MKSMTLAQMVMNFVLASTITPLKLLPQMVQKEASIEAFDWVSIWQNIGDF